MSFMQAILIKTASRNFTFLSLFYSCIQNQECSF